MRWVVVVILAASIFGGWNWWTSRHPSAGHRPHPLLADGPLLLLGCARPGLPLPPQVLQSHAAQMHMVPGDAPMEGRLKDLRPGQIVRIQGWLVDIRRPGGFMWNTSLRRDDTGNGACEIVYIDTLDVL